MKISLCIDSLFKGWDMSEALTMVKSSGIDAFEFWNWRRKDIDQLEIDMKRLGLTLTTFCVVDGSLNDRGGHKEYMRGLQEAIIVAKRLGCHMLITTAGNELQVITREHQLENVAMGLKSVVNMVEQEGITLLLEPLNTKIDHPGHLLSRSSEAFDIIDEVGSDHVKLLFDIYHQQITEGNVNDTLTSRLSSIGHVHAAGYPGRHELHIGEIPYADLFQTLRTVSYQGYIGLEYFPSLEIADGLTIAKKLIKSQI